MIRDLRAQWSSSAQSLQLVSQSSVLNCQRKLKSGACRVRSGCAATVVLVWWRSPCVYLHGVHLTPSSTPSSAHTSLSLAPFCPTSVMSARGHGVMAVDGPISMSMDKPLLLVPSTPASDEVSLCCPSLLSCFLSTLLFPSWTCHNCPPPGQCGPIEFSGCRVLHPHRYPPLCSRLMSHRRRSWTRGAVRSSSLR